MPTPDTDGINTDQNLDIGNEVSLEKIGKFCYLGDTVDADGWCDLSVKARVRSAWKKFREYLPVLTKMVLVITDRQGMCAFIGLTMLTESQLVIWPVKQTWNLAKICKAKTL